MKIRVIDVSQPESVNSGKNRYSKINVTYRDEDSGKVGAKQIVSFSYPEVYQFLSKATKDLVLDIHLSKNDKGFWDWTGVGEMQSSNDSTAKSPAPAAPAAYKRPVPDYETGEERRERQHYIIRQSSISNAIETLKQDKKALGIEEVLSVAEKYEDWVTRRPTAMEAIRNMKDDLPE